MNKQSLFLLAASVGLVPIALGYGAAPTISMPTLYQVDVDSVGAAHVLRAVMGLYLGMVVLWVTGAFNESMRLPALWSLIVFMLGLAAGRALSLVLDGMPSPLLLIYLLLEIGFGAVGLYLVRSAPER